MTSRLILTYIERERGEDGVRRLLEYAGLPWSEDELRDEGRWFSYATKIRLMDAVCEVMGDPHANYAVGAAALDLNAGAGIKRAARVLGSPRMVLANMMRVGAKLTSTHRYEVIELSDHHAVLRFSDIAGVGYDTRLCDSNMGLLSSAPELFGMPPAKVEHPSCGADGAEACVFHVSWRPRVRGTVSSVSIAAASAAVLAGATALGEFIPGAIGIAAAGALFLIRQATRERTRRVSRLTAQVEDRTQALERMTAAMRDLTSTLQTGEVVGRIARDAQAAVAGRDFALLLAGPDGLESHTASDLPPGIVATLEEWGNGTASPQDLPVVIDDLADAPELADLTGDRRFPVGSLCAAPLAFRGRRLGLLIALSSGSHSFFPYDANLIGAYAAQAAVALANAQLVERLEGLISRDPLTDLANQRGFDEALEREAARAATQRSPITVGILDLHTFRDVNARHGRAHGDDLLRDTAARLTQAMGPGAVVARLAGAEFGVLLVGEDLAASEALVEAARLAVADIAVDADTKLACTAAVACHPVHTLDAVALPELARGTLAWAKGTGAGTSVYDPDHVTTASGFEHRAEIADLLDRRDALSAVYQPIVDLTTGAIAGYEALARFRTDVRRTPDVWFAQAARCGLGPELEAAAVRAALAAEPAPGSFLSINASPSAIASPEVCAALPDDLTNIVIELTEHELFAADSSLDDAIAGLRERGARIALDDAGAGYSGLQQLIRIRPDIVKLDRTLVDGAHADPTRASLIESLASFARNTGAEVCAEGIEDPRDLALVERLGVTYAQGYLLAKPGPPFPELALDVAALVGTGSRF